MRRTTIAAFMLLFTFLFFNKLAAQKGLGFGVVGGTNYASYKYSGNKGIKADYDPGFGFYAGAFVSIPLGAKVTFAPELIYAYQTAKGKGKLEDLLNAFSDEQIPEEYGAFGNIDIHLDAKETLIVMPLMFRLKILKFDVGAGPQIGYSISREMYNEELNVDAYDLIETKEEDNYSLNMNFDAGFYILDDLKVNARYSYGLLIRDEVRVNVWQLGLVYQIL